MAPKRHSALTVSFPGTPPRHLLPPHSYHLLSIPDKLFLLQEPVIGIRFDLYFLSFGFSLNSGIIAGILRGLSWKDTLELGLKAARCSLESTEAVPDSLNGL